LKKILLYKRFNRYIFILNNNTSSAGHIVYCKTVYGKTWRSVSHWHSTLYI